MTVRASDNVAITSLKFYVDGALIGVVAPPAPTWRWDTTDTPNGRHTLKVTATDAAGNTAQASTSVKVSNRKARPGKSVIGSLD